MGRWWGAEAKFTYTGYMKHKLLYGTEYRNDYQQDFYLPQASLQNSQYLLSAYIQDEYEWLSNLKFNIGARFDDGGKNATYLSPRLAALYAVNDDTDLKVSYASAFRRPNAYEKYYTDPASQLPNANLRKETVNATEVVLEHRPDSQTRLLGSMFHYTTHNLISMREVGGGLFQYGNLSDSITRGADFEIQHFWRSGVGLKSSYSWQLSENSQGQWQVNSPKHLFKSNLSIPLLSNKAFLGLEWQAYGARLSESRNEVPGYSVVNVTLSSFNVIPHVQVSATVRNLFNRDYAVVASSFNTQDTISQDGRNLWVQMVYQWQ